MWTAAEAGNFARADRVARELSDDLPLIQDDLGWGTGHGEPLEPATPPDVLHRVRWSVELSQPSGSSAVTARNCSMSFIRRTRWRGSVGEGSNPNAS